MLAPSEYTKAGACVVRKLVEGSELASLLEAWTHFSSERLRHREVDPFNPVVVTEVAPDALSDIHRMPPLLDLMAGIYPDLALYGQRFMVKDQRSRGPVFLHQDFGYDHGWPEKTSLFLALSPVNAENGGLILYPGTHAFGYLGDAGEIDAAAFEGQWSSVCPSLEPGDAVLMHECLWHASHPHSSGPDRVLVQVTYQPASDPSSAALLRGAWQTDLRLGADLRHKLFKRSRSSRLRELQSEVDRQSKATPLD
jgi:hypothetical protein